jgi:hypothetical protein
MSGRDTVMAYTGHWRAEGEQFEATVFATRHSPGPGAFGEVDDVEVTLTGQFKGGITASCKGTAKQAPGFGRHARSNGGGVVPGCSVKQAPACCEAGQGGGVAHQPLNRYFTCYPATKSWSLQPAAPFRESFVSSTVRYHLLVFFSALRLWRATRRDEAHVAGVAAMLSTVPISTDKTADRDCVSFVFSPFWSPFQVLLGQVFRPDPDFSRQFCFPIVGMPTSRRAREVLKTNGKPKMTRCNGLRIGDRYSCINELYGE